MSDTLKTIVKTVEKTTDNSIDLINKVDSFYNSAWDKLIIVGSIAFAIIGILVPYVIQWYQKKTLKISEELLKKGY
jgi:LPS O-antigen subunit length determinant protein (WzzB/FepE family)